MDSNIDKQFEYMALKLNTMDRRALIEKFHQMDKNCDGVLTPSEIRLCVQRSGLPPSKVDVSFH